VVLAGTVIFDIAENAEVGRGGKSKTAVKDKKLIKD